MAAGFAVGAAAGVAVLAAGVALTTGLVVLAAGLVAGFAVLAAGVAFTAGEAAGLAVGAALTAGAALPAGTGLAVGSAFVSAKHTAESAKIANAKIVAMMITFFMFIISFYGVLRCYLKFPSDCQVLSLPADGWICDISDYFSLEIYSEFTNHFL